MRDKLLCVLATLVVVSVFSIQANAQLNPFHPGTIYGNCGEGLPQQCIQVGFSLVNGTPGLGVVSLPCVLPNGTESVQYGCDVVPLTPVPGYVLEISNTGQVSTTSVFSGGPFPYLLLNYSYRTPKRLFNVFYKNSIWMILLNMLFLETR